MNCPNCRCYVSKETLKCPYCGYSFAAGSAPRAQTSAYSTYPLYVSDQNQRYYNQGTQPTDTRIYQGGAAGNNNQPIDYNVRGSNSVPGVQKRKINLRVLFPLGLMIVALQTLILLLQIIILCK